MVYRAYYAYPALTSPSGQLVNAVYGFTALLLKTIEELKPDYLAVAFDLPIPTFRHEAYIAYQAKRKTMDVEMKDQIALVQEMLEAARIPIFTAAGFEADDVIATITRLATQGRKNRQTEEMSGKGLKTDNRNPITEVVIVTGDRDMLQLVSDKVKICMPIKGVTETRIFGREKVKEYLGVYPRQVVDYKALIGDASDNYPGVPGIGPKTAVELINKFGTLENIYQALGTGQEAIAGKLANKLAEGYESAVLSKKLATISQDVPIEFDLHKAKLDGFKANKNFLNKLEEFGFRSLIARVKGKEEKVLTKKGISKENGQMKLT